MVEGQLATAMLAGTLLVVRRPPLVQLVPAGHAAPAMLAGTLLVVRRQPLVPAPVVGVDTRREGRSKLDAPV